LKSKPQPVFFVGNFGAYRWMRGYVGADVVKQTVLA
jgi:hypothetical protein